MLNFISPIIGGNLNKSLASETGYHTHMINKLTGNHVIQNNTSNTNVTENSEVRNQRRNKHENIHNNKQELEKSNQECNDNDHISGIEDIGENSLLSNSKKFNLVGYEEDRDQLKFGLDNYDKFHSTSRVSVVHHITVVDIISSTEYDAESNQLPQPIHVLQPIQDTPKEIYRNAIREINTPSVCVPVIEEIHKKAKRELNTHGNCKDSVTDIFKSGNRKENQLCITINKEVVMNKPESPPPPLPPKIYPPPLPPKKWKRKPCVRSASFSKVSTQPPCCRKSYRASYRQICQPNPCCHQINSHQSSYNVMQNTLLQLVQSLESQGFTFPDFNHNNTLKSFDKIMLPGNKGEIIDSKRNLEALDFPKIKSLRKTDPNKLGNVPDVQSSKTIMPYTNMISAIETSESCYTELHIKEDLELQNCLTDTAKINNDNYLYSGKIVKSEEFYV